MKKIWLLIIPILLCLLSCDMSMPGTGGNPDEGSSCKGVTKNHAKKYYFDLTLKCLYEDKCDVKLYFDAGYYSDSLSVRCFSGYELNLVTREISKTVLSEKEYNVPLDSDDHLLFSLIDINNVEKKYDIDLSGITRSYTVRGDSVDVNVMNGCRLSLYSCNKDFVYGSRLPDGKYSFLITDKCEDHYGYKCEWHNQGPSQKDDLNIYATVYWRK